MVFGQSIGRAVLALLGGHLFALASFEVSRMWAFSPYTFRPFLTILMVLACCLVFGMHQMLGHQPFRVTVLCLGWAAVLGIPLHLPPVFTLFGLAIVSAALCLACATPRGAGLLLGGALVLAAVGYLYHCHGIIAGLLLVGALVEVSYPSGVPIKPWRDAEISWNGFGELMEQSAPGEGEVFARKVVSDSHDVLRACGAVRLEQTPTGGVYRFDTVEAMQVSEFHLREYRDRVGEVLQAIQISPLELTVVEK